MAESNNDSSTSNIWMALELTACYKQSKQVATVSIMARPDVEVFANDVQLNDRDEATERFVLISAGPAMPVITVANNSVENIRVRLKIEYTKNSNGNTIRKWLNYYPPEQNDEVQTQTITTNTNWSFDFGDDIRGGTATVEYVIGEDEWNDENVQTFVFYLRGTNPSRDEVVTYIEEQGYDDQYWFLMRLIRHESGTGTNNEFRHFNQGTNYTTDDNSTIGLPNWGYPRGYGLGQIDNFGRLSITERAILNLNSLEEGETIVDDDRTIDRNGWIVASNDEVWNWKENINAAIYILDSKKTDVINYYNSSFNFINNWNANNLNNLVEPHEDSTVGDITFQHAGTSIEDFGNINQNFDLVDTGENIHSFIDATLIKYYNSGYYYRLNRGAQPPSWYIDNLNGDNFDYVNRICNEED